MKLKHRLSLYSIAIFSIVMFVFSALIYFASHAQMEQKENQKLESKSLLAAIYYLEQDELSFTEHANVRNRLYKAISRHDIAVFDSLNRQYSGKMKSTKEISTGFLQQVRLLKNAFFETDSFFYNGIFYHDNQGDFVIVTRESKMEFNAQMRSLFHILLGVFLLGLLFIFLFSQYLSYIAYQPIVKIINQIKDRDSNNFKEPLTLSKTYSEVEDLVKTYNSFVTRIAEMFDVQKNFIDYVSHELRTPITALMGTLDVTKSRPRSKEEYDATIQQLQQYTVDLQETLDQMMVLSGAKTNFEFSKVRIDEVIWQVIEDMVRYDQALVDVDIQVKEQSLLTMEGNDKLLALAIGNLLENAIKYSDNQLVRILFLEEHSRLSILVVDKGIGIPVEDLKNIKQNFYRGHNTQHHQGKGVGLSIASIIFTLHHIDMSIVSTEEGVTIRLNF